MDSTYVDVKKISDETRQWLVDDMHTHLLTFGDDGEPSIVGNLSEDHFQILDECPKAIVYAALPFLNLLFAMNAIPHEEDDAFVCISTIRPGEIPENVVAELDVRFDIRSSELVREAEQDFDSPKDRGHHEYIGEVPRAIRKRLLWQDIYSQCAKTFRPRAQLSYDEQWWAVRFFVPDAIHLMFSYLADAGRKWDFDEDLDTAWFDCDNEGSPEWEDDWEAQACFLYDMSERSDIAQSEMAVEVKSVFKMSLAILARSDISLKELSMQEDGAKMFKEVLDDYGFASAVDAYLSGVPVEDIVA